MSFEAGEGRTTSAKRQGIASHRIAISLVQSARQFAFRIHAGLACHHRVHAMGKMDVIAGLQGECAAHAIAAAGTGIAHRRRVQFEIGLVRSM